MRYTSLGTRERDAVTGAAIRPARSRDRAGLADSLSPVRKRSAIAGESRGSRRDLHLCTRACRDRVVRSAGLRAVRAVVGQPVPDRDRLGRDLGDRAGRRTYPRTGLPTVLAAPDTAGRGSRVTCRRAGPLGDSVPDDSLDAAVVAAGWRGPHDRPDLAQPAAGRAGDRLADRAGGPRLADRQGAAGQPRVCTQVRFQRRARRAARAGSGRASRV